MMTFYSDSEAMNYRFFEDWLGIVANSDMSAGISGNDGVANAYEVYYKDDYSVDGMVTLFDQASNEVATWRYRQMYPIDMPHIKLGWAITNDVKKLTVIFTFMDKYLDLNAGGTYQDASGLQDAPPTPSNPQPN
jgi:hypothetical protein